MRSGCGVLDVALTTPHYRRMFKWRLQVIQLAYPGFEGYYLGEVLKSRNARAGEVPKCLIPGTGIPSPPRVDAKYQTSSAYSGWKRVVVVEAVVVIFSGSGYLS